MRQAGYDDDGHGSRIACRKPLHFMKRRRRHLVSAGGNFFELNNKDAKTRRKRFDTDYTDSRESIPDPKLTACSRSSALMSEAWRFSSTRSAVRRQTGASCSVGRGFHQGRFHFPPSIVFQTPEILRGPSGRKPERFLRRLDWEKWDANRPDWKLSRWLEMLPGQLKNSALPFLKKWENAAKCRKTLFLKIGTSFFLKLLDNLLLLGNNPNSLPGKQPSNLETYSLHDSCRMSPYTQLKTDGRFWQPDCYKLTCASHYIWYELVSNHAG
jgi:hypothetical protein